MFKYNELSDLLNGDLVTPLKKENGQILCVDKNGDSVYYNYEDFDFDKLPQDRILDDSKNDQEIDKIIEIDDSTIDGTDIVDETDVSEPVIAGPVQEGFLSSVDSCAVASKVLNTKNNEKYLVWRDII